MKNVSAAAAAAAKSLQSCPTLCDPIDVSPPGSLVPGILQTRSLEWVAISFSLDKFPLKHDRTQAILFSCRASSERLVNVPRMNFFKICMQLSIKQIISLLV